MTAQHAKILGDRASCGSCSAPLGQLVPQDDGWWLDTSNRWHREEGVDPPRWRHSEHSRKSTAPYEAWYGEERGRPIARARADIGRGRRLSIALPTLLECPCGYLQDIPLDALPE